MNADHFGDNLPSAKEIWKAGQTLAVVPEQNDKLFSRLEYIANLLADAGTLPNAPILLWRESTGLVKHAAIGAQLTVGRQPGSNALELPKDKSLSAAHFKVSVSGEDCVLTDLGSRNGTRINESVTPAQTKFLCDGDLILAGKHIFAFLNSRRDA